MGVKAGVADIFLAYPENNKHGLWMEIKANNKSPVSPSQKKFLTNMDKLGFSIYIARSLDECKQSIINYLQKSFS